MEYKYIYKCFFLMGMSIVVLLLILATFIYAYSRNNYLEGFIETNTISVIQISQNVENSLDSIYNNSTNITLDSDLIEVLRGGTSPDNNLDDIINKKLSNLNQKSYNFYSGTYYNKSLPIDYDETLFLDTTIDKTQTGIYKYNFSMKKSIIDPFTGIYYGYIDFLINEKILSANYDFITNIDNSIFIVNKSGTILSSKDKSLINTNLHDLELDKSYFNYKFNNRSKIVFVDKIRNTNWYVLKLVDTSDVTSYFSNLTLFTIAIVILCFIIIFFLERHFAKKMSAPIDHIIRSLDEVTKENFNVKLSFEEEHEFSKIGDSFNRMINKINSLLISVKNEEKAKRIMEIDFLRAQINPHFIHNTLSSIRFYVDMGKSQEAEKMLLYFSQILKKTLSKSDDLTRVIDEIEILKSYIGLQKLRYEKNFVTTFNINDELYNYYIPSFILQPILENAIYYNINNYNITNITIDIFTEDKKVFIVIEDNGIGISEDKLQTILKKNVSVNSIGITNVNDRIQLLFGVEYGLTIQSIPDEGTKVTLILPTIEDEF